MKCIKLLSTGVIFLLISLSGFSQTTIDFTKDFDPTILQVPASLVNDPLCGGNTGGIIVDNVFENLPGSPVFTYRLQGQGTVQDSVYQVVTTSRGPISFSNLARGGYNLTISTPVLPPGSQGTKVSYLSIQIITINPILPISVSPSQVNPKCPSTTNGSATLTATGGTQPYTFSWSGLPGSATVTTGATSTSASGLPVGSYTATATDVNGCSSSYTFNIVQDLPTVNLVTNPPPPVCQAAFPPNVPITWTASPGAGWTPNPAGAYSWDGGVTFSNITTQSQTATTFGFYTRTVIFKDINNCLSPPTPATVPIDRIPNGTVNPVTANVCPGQTVPLTVSIAQCSAIGAGPCQVSFDNGSTYQTPGDNDSTFTVNAPQTVTIRITNQTGCVSAPITAQLDTLGKPHITYTVNPSPICPNNTTNITVNFICNPTNCSGYTYSFNGGATTNVPASATTTFTSPMVTATTAFPLVVQSTCRLDTSITVNVFPNNTLINAPDTIVCANNLGPNGPVTLTASGFNSITDWDPIPGIQTTTSVSVVPSVNTTYTVSGIDLNGCPRQATKQVVSLAQPDVTTPTPVTKCEGGPGVTLTASAAGPITTYDWQNSSFVSQFIGNPYVVNPTVNTTFNVIGTDPNGCKDTAQVNVVVSPRPVIQSSTATPGIICKGNTTSIQITAVAPFTPNASGAYSISNGIFYSGTTSPSYTFPTAGPFPSTTTVYTKIKNSLGCVSDSVPVTINVNPFSFTANANNPTCSYDSDGSITISSVTGGVGPYSYSLNGGPTTVFTTPVTISNLPSNTYPLVVTDASAPACKDSTSLAVIIPAPLEMVNTGINHVVCRGDANGSVPVSVTGGTLNLTYYINVTTGAPAIASTSNRTPSYTGLAAGTYNFIVVDAGGCMDTVYNIQINQPAASLVAPTITPPSFCFGTSTGVFTMSPAATGGWGSYTYTFNGSAIALGGTRSGMAAGTYPLSVTDANGCTANTTVTFTSSPQLFANISTTSSDCGVNGAIDFQAATGGTPGYTYSLDGVTYGASIPADMNPVTVNTTATLYVKDSQNCLDDTTVTVLNIPRGIPIVSIVPPTCPGGSDGSIRIDSVHVKIPGGEPFDYQLFTDSNPLVSVGTAGPSNANVAVTFNSLSGGNHILQMSDQACANYAVDSFRVYTGPTTYTVVTTPAPVNSGFAAMFVPQPAPFTTSSIALASDIDHYTGTVILYNLKGGTPLAGPAYQMSIDNPSALVNRTLLDTLGGQTYVAFSGLAPGAHTVYIRDANGCSDQILIQVPGKFFIPNLVTPNADAANDVFEIVSLPDNSELRLYNRWGDRVYESSNYDNKYDFKGLSDGVYYYDLEFNTGTRFKGWVQVLR